jgi:hypothetical protein
VLLQSIGLAVHYGWPAVREGLYSLFACRGSLFVPNEFVCLMAAHARLVFHEWIGLELSHLIAVTGFACAECGHGREVRCCGFAMADGAFNTVGGVRAGLPLFCHGFVTGGAGIPGWNLPMVNMFGLLLLSEGWLDGDSQDEKGEQGRTIYKCAETLHGRNSYVG